MNKLFGVPIFTSKAAVEFLIHSRSGFGATNHDTWDKVTGQGRDGIDVPLFYLVFSWSSFLTARETYLRVPCTTILIVKTRVNNKLVNIIN